MRIILLCATLTVLSLITSRAEDPSAHAYSVEVSATVQSAPAQIRLQWVADSNSTNYAISRKLLAASSWTPVASLPGSATSWTDTSVTAGSAFEYQLIRKTSAGYTGTGYIYAGINAPPVENRGKVILLVDSTWSAALATELQRLQQDLTGDGWTVLRQDVARSTSVPAVKSIIQSLYAADPGNTKTLFIFGHIAVPYSGDYAHDSHLNHTGAWPGDAYYADVDGSWTDATVNDVQAEKEWNHNIPGDGKFDQSFLPSDVELEAGRVDLYNMTCFSNKTPSRDELALLRQYLNKDHNFRTGQLPVPRRGLICQNFYPDSEALPATGWRNFAPLFGAANNIEVSGGSFFSTLDSQGYLFVYGDGGGGYYTCNGVGGSDDFALNDIKAVFTFFFGSYFGDWDNESSFLRAPLGSTTWTLTSAWGSRPKWIVHPMGLGETIGFSARLTMNNSGLYQPTNDFTRGVEATLMRDPTLRLHPVIPPANPSAATGGGVTVSWTASSDTPLLGYYVYRGSSDAGPFTRVSGAAPVSATSYSDASGTSSSVYMIRAVKLETSGSGTYTNLSQGVFARPGSPPAAPSKLQASVNSGQVALSWTGPGGESGFYIYRKLSTDAAYARIATVPAGSISYTDATVSSGNSYSYEVSAYNSAGESAFSNAASVTLAGSGGTTTSATLVALDSTTKGSWKGVYGREGYNVIEDTVSYPAYLSVAASGNSSWVWNWSTADPDALMRASASTRLAACWYSFSPWTIQLSFSDSVTHRVALYFIDWDYSGRQEVLEVLDSATSQVLASQTLQNFQTGIYTIWDLKGQVTLRLRPLSGNAVLSGIFFDSPVPTVAAPVFSPSAGTYTNSVSVTLSSATSGATIRYTTDGSTPTSASTLYASPVTLSNSVTLNARAFKSGLNDSTVSTASYSIVRQGGPAGATVTFNGVNTTRGGTWKGAVGSQGAIVAGDTQTIPSYVTVTPSGKSEWTWEYSTSDTRALERESLDSRIASCWYSSGSFDVDLNFSDGQPHQLSLYCLDWDNGGRQQRIDIVDFTSGQVLKSYTLSGFSGGAYLDYTVTGHVIARFTKVASYNAVLSGIFFDAP